MELNTGSVTLENLSENNSGSCGGIKLHTINISASKQSSSCGHTPPRPGRRHNSGR